MIDIRQLDTPGQKADICNAVLRALPQWFGIEASIVEYVDMVGPMPFWAAFEGDAAVGFVALKIHNPHTAEVCVMGVMEGYHRHGIGRRLVACCQDFCRGNGMEFLTVKTLAQSAPSPEYAKTREFYQAMGFLPLEVFPLHWDRHNPCLFMAKHLG